MRRTTRKNSDRWSTESVPGSPLVGRFAVVEAVVDALERVLPTYRGPDGTHEGMALLCGVERDGLAIFTTAVFPDADHRTGYVQASDRAFAAASQAAQAHGLGVLAQVHTHPSGWTYHSEGDDDMVRPRYEGMLSIVVPHYAQHGLRPLHSLGVHQLQGGRWVLIDPTSIKERILVIPAGVDLRG